MSTSRTLTTAEKIVLTSIFTTDEKSNQSITEILTKTASDLYFIAAICTRAIAESDKERCKNIITEGSRILNPDQISKLCEEVRKNFTQEQIDQHFLMHMNDDYPETFIMLGECGLSKETLKTYLDQQTKPFSIWHVKNWVIQQCRKDNDFSLLHLFASKATSDNGFAGVLLFELNEVPATDKNRIDIIKKLIKSNILFHSNYRNSPHLNSFDHAVNRKEYEIIECMAEVASQQEHKYNIEYIAKGVARALKEDKNPTEVIQAVNKKFDPRSKSYFIESLKKSLTQQEAEDVFVKHLGDKTQDVLTTIMDLGIVTNSDLAIKEGHYYIAELMQSKEKEKIKALQDTYTIDQLNTLYHIFSHDKKLLQAILDEDLRCKTEEKSEPSPLRTVLAKFIFDTVDDCNTPEKLKNAIDILTPLLHQNILKIPKKALKKILNYRDDKKNTALHKAAMHDHFDLVNLLLDAGASNAKRNIFGESPSLTAEKNQHITTAKLLQTGSSYRAQLTHHVKVLFGMEKYENNLHKVPQFLRKENTHKSLMGDHAALQEIINYYLTENDFGRLIIISAVGAMFSRLNLQLASYRAEITDLKIDDLSWFLHGTSEKDKEKLKYLQDFFINNLDTLCEMKKQEAYKDLDPFTLILLVMKQKLKDCSYKHITTKQKIESSIRTLMGYELAMYPMEIDYQMDRSRYLVDKILGLNPSETEITKIYKSNKDVFIAILKGEMRGWRRMIDLYFNDTREGEFAKFRLPASFSPKYGRFMLFCAAAAPFVDASDFATYHFYVKNINFHYCSYEKRNTLNLIRNFYLYSFKISKSLKEHYKITDPMVLIFMVLEHASKYKIFSDDEIKQIYMRLKMSLSSAMSVDGGYTQSETTALIAEKESQVAEIIICQSFVMDEILETSIEKAIEVVEQSILPPPAYAYPEASAPIMPLPPAATVISTQIPPLAEVVCPISSEIKISSSHSTLFSLPSAPKLPKAVTDDLEYLRLREQLLDLPMAGKALSLKEENADIQPMAKTMMLN